ncbi:uncharacterized protein LOC106172517 [Lingula anatina]|uniref:NADP-dependent 3-hydroxy acid dehydrogenase YdfG n=1 Tax=Lingula anatina TaxID=7574 RepID=A0A1S3JEZ7_LINAN|nr:uncharacterized protein LOC106172517 [Lingula anatina]|eukprot:XP_013408721.1 uncharacterized protein LOC106172517 [Lingula anatina]
MEATQMNKQDDKPLSGKVAVVTGASCGIGAAISRHLAAAGAKVAMAARREEMLNELKETIKKEGGEAIAVKCDVSNRTQVKEMIKQTEESFGPVDILVNSAGVWYFSFMKNVQEDEWERTVDVNIKGVLNCIGAVLSDMCERRSGHIVNISSDSGRVASIGMAVYTGTKFFMEGMTRTLRQEVCKEGVKVTSVQPGAVDTPGLTDSCLVMDDECKKIYSELAEGIKVSADDIARVVLYALKQPDEVAINEVLIQPRDAPL